MVFIAQMVNVTGYTEENTAKLGRNVIFAYINTKLAQIQNFGALVSQKKIQFISIGIS